MATPDDAGRTALPVVVRGACQLRNASAALVVVDLLGQRLPVSMQAIRIGLSLALFALLMAAWWMGLIQPHGIGR